MTDKIRNIVEDVSEEVQETEQPTEEVNSEEVVEGLESTESEVSEETEEEVEEVAEAKVKKEEDEEEEVEETAKAPSMPKTKAGVINAAMEMLKKARKHEAQQLFAKMISNIESTDDGSVDKAIDGQKKKEKDKTIQAKPSDASAKQENVDWDEDLDILVAEEATLSDGFRDKAGTIFQAAFTTKVGSEIDRLESEYAQNLETEVSDIQTDGRKGRFLP